MTQNARTTTKPNRDLRPAYIAWHVTEKPEKKPFWTRIGAAWSHQDGKGLTLQLDLIPVGDGRITLRVPSEDTADRANIEEEARA